MTKITRENMNRIISDHQLWLADKSRGKQADFSKMDLSGVDLSYVDLPHAEFHGADLTGANLSGANLYGAGLSDVNLSNANLHEANLHEANMYDVNLSGTDLTEADLSGVNLCGANLYGADLRRSILFGVDLCDIRGPILSIGAIGSRRGTTYAYGYDGQIYVNCGCFNGTLDEFGARVAQVHGDTRDGQAYASACNYIRVQARIYDWFPEKKEDDND